MRPVYFMPGMAANYKIFENIKLDSKRFESHYLEWLEPLKEEALESYVSRICEKIKHPNPILIGVSFGGIIVQEIAKQRPVDKVIIISSVKDPSEFPSRIHWAKKWKLYHLFPSAYVNSLETLTEKLVSSDQSAVLFRMSGSFAIATGPTCFSCFLRCMPTELIH